MSLTPLEFRGFPGGLVLNVDPTSLETSELSEAMNVRIGNKGEVARRTGYVQWSTGIAPPVEHQHRWTEIDGADNTIAVSLNGDMFVARDNGWQFGTVSTDLGYSPRGDFEKYPISFAASQDRLYVSTLRQTRMLKWDGRTLSKVTDVYQTVDPDDKNSYIQMPVGQHVAYRHGRMYVGHTKAETSRVWFSNVLFPEAFHTESWVDLDPEDGSTITAMTTYADELFIFKDNSMWEMTGRDPTTYSLRTVDKLRGTVSPKSVCQMRGLLVFFDRDTGLWGYDGSQLTLLSEKINEYLLEGQDYDEANTAAAYYGDDRLYLSVRWKATNRRRTFVMNAENGAWSEYDTGFIVGAYRHAGRFQSYDHKSGFLRADENTDTIGGDAYESHFATTWFFPLGPGVKARVQRIEMVVQGRQGGEVDVELFREMQEKHHHVHQAMQMNYDHIDLRRLSIEYHPIHTIAMTGWGKRLHSMKIRVGLKYLPMQVNRIVTFVTGGEDVRGSRH